MPRNLNLCFTISSPPSDPPSQINHSPPSTHSHLVKNFNSLYDPTTTAAATTTSDSETGTTTEPDFATAFASRRFFFSSPGRSNSIIDSSTSSIASTSSSSSATSLPNDAVSGDSIAVHTESPDPFLDFRRSMQEMVEARELHDVAQSWDDLHELLMCYLSLNPKSTHKFIVGAFADLLVTLMTEKGRPKTPLPAVANQTEPDPRADRHSATVTSTDTDERRGTRGQSTLSYSHGDERAERYLADRWESKSEKIFLWFRN